MSTAFERTLSEICGANGRSERAWHGLLAPDDSFALAYRLRSSSVPYFQDLFQRLHWRASEPALWLHSLHFEPNHSIYPADGPLTKSIERVVPSGCISPLYNSLLQVCLHGLMSPRNCQSPSEGQAYHALLSTTAMTPPRWDLDDPMRPVAFEKQHSSSATLKSRSSRFFKLSPTLITVKRIFQNLR